MSSADRLPALRAGFDAYLPKPLDCGALVRLAALLGGVPRPLPVD